MLLHEVRALSAYICFSFFYLVVCFVSKFTGLVFKVGLYSKYNNNSLVSFVWVVYQ